VYLLMLKSRWGIRIRATTQNRIMSSAVGINTDRVDRFTFALGCGIAGLAGAADSAGSSSNSNGCKVVHLKPGENAPSGMSTSIQAGNGQVSGHTSVGGSGNGVSVSSGSGSSVTTGAGAASSSMTTTNNGKTTTVVSSDGGCTVYQRD